MQYTLTRSIYITRSLNFKWKVSLRILGILGSVSIFALLVLYIFQVNSLAQEVFLIKDYQKNLAQLSENNEKLEINFAKFSSLENIENYLQNQNFEKVNANQIKYIRILESSVVKKR